MKFNNIILTVLAILTFLARSPSFATDGESEAITSEKRNIPSLENQLDNVIKFITQRKKDNLPVKMVLGATNKECDRISDESYIFFDMLPHNTDGRTYIQASFNDIPQLTTIANSLRSCLKEIVMDDSTFKFTNWTIEHIKLFTLMLTTDGEFVFCPEVQFWESDPYYKASTDQEILTALKVLNNFSIDKISRGYTVPLVLFSDIDMNSPEFKEQFCKYEPLEQFKNLSDKESLAKQKSLGVTTFYFPSAFENEIILKKTLARNIKSKILIEIANDFYYSHVQNVFKQHFNIVDMLVNSSLPFPSNSTNTTLPLVIHAKYPK